MTTWQRLEAWQEQGYVTLGERECTLHSHDGPPVYGYGPDLEAAVTAALDAAGAK